MKSELAKKFMDEGCVLIKDFLDPTTTMLFSRYMENCVNQNIYIDRDAQDKYKDSHSRFSRYGDPLTESLLVEKLEKVQEIVGVDLYPTYSYSRIYLISDSLSAHVDRPSCEYSVTVNVAKVGHSWPIYMKNKEKEESMFLLNPGDAIIYKGCDMLHWRPPLSQCGAELNAQFMLHYVDKNGVNKEYKWDKRPSLGLSSEYRGG